MGSFYISLPSNVKSVTSHTNTISHYETVMPTTINLTGQWEVGLAEMSYTKSYFNVPQDTVVRIVFDAQPNPGNETVYSNKLVEHPILKKLHFETYKNPNRRSIILTTIRKGQYNDPTEICEQIRKAGEKYSNTFMKAGNEQFPSPYLTYLPNQNLVEMHIFCTYGILLWLKFEPALRDILGIHQIVQERVDETLKDKGLAKIEISKNPYVDIKGGIHHLYVYTNIVEPTITGDTYANTLRVIAVKPGYSHGEQITIPYDRPQYHLLNTNQLSVIEILILDGSGEKIPFTFGTASVLLHLRKINDNNE